MADELMRAIDYTPTIDVVRHALTYPRLRLGEPRHMTTEAVDRWLAAYEAEVRERIAQEIEAVDPIEWALAGQRAGEDAARIARGATR